MKSVAYELTLFDDESTREKSRYMCPLDIMYDDDRNDVPEEYWHLVENLIPGESIKITIDKI